MGFNAVKNPRIRYSFTYNAKDKAVEFSYSFAPYGWRRDFAVDFAYVRRIAFYRGQKPNPVFDDPHRTEEAARQAEALFGRELGSALDVAIQQLFFNIAKRVGIRGAVRKGPHKGSTWSWGKRPKLTPEEFSAKLDEAICSYGDAYPARSSVAKRMNLGSADTLDRYREHFEGKSLWRDRVKSVPRE